MQHRYYTLIGSLPYLPHFEQAEHLPINRQRLDRRLTLLHPEDRATVRRVEAILSWQTDPTGRGDAALIADYTQLRATLIDRAVIRMLDHPLEVRTIVGALRRRALGRPAPEPGEAWGIGPWVTRIERQWQRPDFGLASALPWLPRARARLECDDQEGLERLLMGEIWLVLDRIEEAHRFSFAGVLAYLGKWDIVKRRLQATCDVAAARLDALTCEALGEHAALFSGSPQTA